MDEKFLYKLIISQLSHDGYRHIAGILKDVVGIVPDVTPSSHLRKIVKICVKWGKECTDILPLPPPDTQATTVVKRETGCDNCCGRVQTAQGQVQDNVDKTPPVYTIPSPTSTPGQELYKAPDPTITTTTPLYRAPAPTNTTSVALFNIPAQCIRHEKRQPADKHHSVPPPPPYHMVHHTPNVYFNPVTQHSNPSSNQPPLNSEINTTSNPASVVFLNMQSKPAPSSDPYHNTSTSQPREYRNIQTTPSPLQPHHQTPEQVILNDANFHDSDHGDVQLTPLLTTSCEHSTAANSLRTDEAINADCSLTDSIMNFDNSMGSVDDSMGSMSAINLLGLGNANNSMRPLSTNDSMGTVTIKQEVKSPDREEKFNIARDDSDEYRSRRDYKCYDCDKVFQEECYLKVHFTKVHRRGAEYHCPHCHKAFVEKRFLVQHVKYHSETRPFNCTLCLKGFMKPSDLKRHLMIHTGERPYTCDICAKGFIQFTGLAEHRKKHENASSLSQLEDLKRFRTYRGGSCGVPVSATPIADSLLNAATGIWYKNGGTSSSTDEHGLDPNVNVVVQQLNSVIGAVSGDPAMSEVTTTTAPTPTATQHYDRPSILPPSTANTFVITEPTFSAGTATAQLVAGTPNLVNATPYLAIPIQHMSSASATHLQTASMQNLVTTVAPNLQIVTPTLAGDTLNMANSTPTLEAVQGTQCSALVSDSANPTDDTLSLSAGQEDPYTSRQEDPYTFSFHDLPELVPELSGAIATGHRLPELVPELSGAIATGHIRTISVSQDPETIDIDGSDNAMEIVDETEAEPETIDISSGAMEISSEQT